MEAGTYKGIRYAKHRVCDVLDTDPPCRSFAWFPWVNENGWADGHYFKTKRELFEYIDDVESGLTRAQP